MKGGMWMVENDGEVRGEEEGEIRREGEGDVHERGLEQQVRREKKPEK